MQPAEVRCRVCGLKRDDYLHGKWPEKTLCKDCKCAIVPVAVTCNFNDGTGKKQTMTFDFDLIAGVEEKFQLKDTSLKILTDKGFFNTTAHKIDYKFLNNI